MLEPIEVTARFDEQGKITPLHFTWKGSVHRVESSGRHWEDEAGQHILVMLSSGRVYALTYVSGDGHWFIEQAGPDRSFA